MRKVRILLDTRPTLFEEVSHTATFTDGVITLKDRRGNLFQLSRSETLAIAKLFREMQEVLI